MLELWNGLETTLPAARNGRQSRLIDIEDNSRPLSLFSGMWIARKENIQLSNRVVDDQVEFNFILAATAAIVTFFAAIVLS